MRRSYGRTAARLIQLSALFPTASPMTARRGRRAAGRLPGHRRAPDRRMLARLSAVAFGGGGREAASIARVVGTQQDGRGIAYTQESSVPAARQRRRDANPPAGVGSDSRPWPLVSPAPEGHGRSPCLIG